MVTITVSQLTYNKITITKKNVFKYVLSYKIKINGLYNYDR